jgi:hypothetical protein
MSPARMTRTLLKLSATFVLLVCTTTTRAHAGEVAFKVKRTFKLDSVGNAEVRMQVSAPTNVYTGIKLKNPNIAVLMRKIGAGRAWNIVENVDGSFNDMQSTIDIHYTQRGVARIEHGNKWSISSGPDEPLELVDVHDTTAIFEEAANTQLGLATLIVRVECPAGSKNLKNDSNARCFSYEFEPSVPATGKTEVTFNVDNKDTIISCLAKCYSNEKFGYMWAARSRFDNTGSTTLSDYRVRFRVAGFSAWSPWHQTSKVYPGQAVIDPYYPVFDFEKIGGLTSPRPAMLETEYEYVRPNGEKVTESDSRRLEIMGNNETIFTGLRASESLSWADRMEYMPAVLASFTTPADPVIQQLAGRVAGRAGGANAAADDKEAIKFMRTFYEFLTQNKVAYQTPPTVFHGEQFVQHIKYPRDVLRNHAGTCVDLAIMWASTCEAVGLHAELVVIPGHCFPVIYLPNGQTNIAIEATAVGQTTFEKAAEIGSQRLQQARQGEAIFVNILAMRKAGIESVDLPAVAPNFLTDEGYHFEAQPQQRQQHVAQEGDNSRSQTPAAPSVVGVWEFEGQTPVGNAQIGLALKEDGRMGFAMILQANDGQRKEFKSSGNWRITNGLLVTTDQTGTHSFQFQFRGEELLVYCSGLQSWVNFHRMQPNSEG